MKRVFKNARVILPDRIIKGYVGLVADWIFLLVVRDGYADWNGLWD